MKCKNIYIILFCFNLIVHNMEAVTQLAVVRHMKWFFILKFIIFWNVLLLETFCIIFIQPLFLITWSCLPGQERFTSMTRVYYKDAHACIVMFDLTHQPTFQNTIKWKEDLDQKCSLQDGSPVPCLLLANKVTWYIGNLIYKYL